MPKSWVLVVLVIGVTLLWGCAGDTTSSADLSSTLRISDPTISKISIGLVTLDFSIENLTDSGIQLDAIKLLVENRSAVPVPQGSTQGALVLREGDLYFVVTPESSSVELWTMLDGDEVVPESAMSIPAQGKHDYEVSVVVQVAEFGKIDNCTLRIQLSKNGRMLVSQPVSVEFDSIGQSE